MSGFIISLLSLFRPAQDLQNIATLLYKRPVIWLKFDSLIICCQRLRVASEIEEYIALAFVGRSELWVQIGSLFVAGKCIIKPAHMVERVGLIIVDLCEFGIELERFIKPCQGLFVSCETEQRSPFAHNKCGVFRLKLDSFFRKRQGFRVALQLS